MEKLPLARKIMCKINNLVQRKAYTELRIVCSKFRRNPSNRLEDTGKLPLARKIMCKIYNFVPEECLY